MEILLAIFIGLGLSAACGFRVFVPLLIASIASLSGHITLSSGFEWIGSYPALIAFGFASILEIVGYFIPFIDNILDAIATPAAIIAGIILAASFISGFSPLLHWTLAVIAGGGAAATIQAGTVTVRAISTGSTGGLGNPLVSTAESGASILMSILAITLPIIAIIVVMVLMFFTIKIMIDKLFKRRIKDSES